MRYVLAVLLSLSAVALGVAMAFAPVAAAGCNDSSGTTVCGQGDVRGTHAPPPSRSTEGTYNRGFCSGGFCYRGGGFGISLGP